MKIGIDIHGVIDSNPKFWREFTETILAQQGNEVHIITGFGEDSARDIVKKLGIRYTHIFSVVDSNIDKGQKYWYTKDKHIWMDSIVWDKTKAEYCKRNNIDLHFDDSDEYGKHFETPYAQWKNNPVEEIEKEKEWEKLQTKFPTYTDKPLFDKNDIYNIKDTTPMVFRFDVVNAKDVNNPSNFDFIFDDKIIYVCPQLGCLEFPHGELKIDSHPDLENVMYSLNIFCEDDLNQFRYTGDMTKEQLIDFLIKEGWARDRNVSSVINI